MFPLKLTKTDACYYYTIDDMPSQHVGAEVNQLNWLMLWCITCLKSFYHSDGDGWGSKDYLTMSTNKWFFSLKHHLTLQHASVCGLWDGVDVGGHLVPLLAPIHLNDVLWIDGQVLVGVDDHAEETRVCLWSETRANSLQLIREKVIHVDVDK